MPAKRKPNKHYKKAARIWAKIMGVPANEIWAYMKTKDYKNDVRYLASEMRMIEKAANDRGYKRGLERGKIRYVTQEKRGERTYVEAR